MHIVINDEDICYCVEHCGEKVIAAVEKRGILTKYYYPEEYCRKRTALSMEILYRYQYHKDVDSDMHYTCIWPDEHAPYAYKDPDTLMALLSEYSDISSRLTFYDEDTDIVEQLFRDLVSYTSVSRYPIAKYLINQNNVSTVTPIHVKAAEQHICQGEYIAKLHAMDDPIWRETTEKVMKHIYSALEAEEEKFNASLDELRKLREIK